MPEKEFRKIIANDGGLIICRCEEITKQEIVDAICEGYITVNDIRKRTRAGMGLCQGKTCGRLVQQIISQYAGRAEDANFPAKVRPPVRPISSEVFVKGCDEIEKGAEN